MKIAATTCIPRVLRRAEYSFDMKCKTDPGVRLAWTLVVRGVWGHLHLVTSVQHTHVRGILT